MPLGLRRDIGAQLSRNRRRVLVDCLERRRVILDPDSWALLKQIDGARDLDDLISRLRARAGMDDATLAEAREFLGAEPLVGWLRPPPSEESEPVRLETTKLERFRALLAHVRDTVRHYRERWPAGDDGVPDARALSRLPSLTRDDVRANFPDGLLATGFDYEALLRRGDAEILYSSGTTREGGSTPSFHVASEDERNTVAPFGIALEDEPQARFSTPRCTGRECYIERQDKAARTFGGSLILNSSPDPFFMSDEELHRVVAELHEWAPALLSGSPLYLVALLRFLEREKMDVPESVVAVLLGTEYVAAPVARYITERVGLVPFDNYAASEIGSIATSCPLGNHHVFDSVLVEVLREDRPAAVGELGEVVVSTLCRRAMPLLRYRVEDLATLLPRCECGVPELALRLEGRMSECLVAGDRVMSAGELDRALADVDGLLFYRAYQEEPDRVTFDYCPVPNASDRSRALADAITDRATACGLRVGRVSHADRIHTVGSMKFGTVISKVPDRLGRVRASLGNTVHGTAG